MYKEEDLTKYSFFSKLKIRYVLDHSTGVITRNYFIDFVNHQIEEKKPFTFIVFEIDNFEQIIENYGYMLCDKFMLDIANRLTAHFGDKGLVARFNAEQFAVIWFGGHSYDEIRAMLYDLYNLPNAPFKLKVNISEITTGLSITTGCVSYPNDGKNIEELTTKIDKTLYRGKQKGRNCFIIYVDEKHKDIDVTKKFDENIISMMAKVSNFIEESDDLKEGVKKSLDYLIKVLRISNAIVILDNEILQSARDLAFDDYGLNINELEKLFDKDNEYVAKYYDSSLIEEASTTLFDLFVNNDVLSLIVAKIHIKDKIFGYVLLCETIVCRLWREKDESIIYFLAKLLAMKKLLD